ncbi:MAG TPA: hypothetical protein VK021_07705 [Flavobacteriaceae bacterium]|nr:hypothetical protein [Flavobacteriaceae bacterium]
MSMFQEKSERKSLVITIVINTALILALLFFGLTYMDPPEERGIAVTFGSSDVGSGNVQPTTPVETVPAAETQPAKETSSEETTTPQESEPEKTTIDEAVTQEAEDAPVIREEDEKKSEKEEEEIDKEKVDKEKTEKNAEEQPEEKPEKTPEPQPEKSTSDALKNILSSKAQNGEATEGEGDDRQAGDKGDPSGDPNAASYYGQGEGLDGDGNYRLGGRKALNKKKYTQECNESGTVVVEIKVNQQGQVIQAKPGVKGTTNTSSCLLNPARRAALETRFNSDAKAPSVQTGYIIYEFKLSE